MKTSTGASLSIRFPLVARKITPFLPTAASRRIGTSSVQRDDQTFVLPDGRVLGYAEYGCQNGYPLMFFHGYPSSRLEGQPIDKIGRRRLRIIAPDRPGFGISTLQPSRRITDWPADVRALAQHLRLPRFAVLGGSGGGPYAVACAYSLPREMLSGVGIIAGSGPWQAGTEGVPLSSRATALAAKHWPAGLTGLANALVGTLRAAMATGPATRTTDNWLKKVKEEQGRESSIEEMRKRILRVAFEGFAQGADGLVQEAQLLTQDWGFNLEDVAYNKIQMWHGTQDKNVPIRMVRYMDERLLHSLLREYPDDTHFTMFRHLEEIISDLVPDERSPERKEFVR